ncbi:MAG: ABC transporter ATP-binding protein [Actinobacteria bacterium]|nr:ABC transporter ATP-binding protein [Actinomycetota bacterium]
MSATTRPGEREARPTGSAEAEGGASREPAVEVVDLEKTFPAPGGGTLTAVDGVSFSVARGEVFGFLGPNGAGKTTTLEIVEGLQSPTAGVTRVLGLDSHRDRNRMKERIGVQLQAGAYFDYLTLEEILDLFGSFYPRQVAPEALLDKVGLLDKRKALVKQLSGGQAQRFSIVASLVNDPEVVFLDEPTTGLDPQARRNLWDLVQAIHDEGTTVVLTTHYMEEAEFLCDRVAIIDNGRIQALDTPLELIHGLPAAYRIVFATHQDVNDGELAALPGVVEVASPANGAATHELRVSRAQVTLPSFLDWASGRGVEVDDVRVLPATLEDVFLSLTGRSLRE